jgi:hypothetical protein
LEKGIKLKTYDTQDMIPSLKLENPKLNLVYSKVLQMVNYTLWSNFKGLAASKKNGRKIEGCIKVKKELCNRVHECPYCGLSCNRDYNASRNILLAGMGQPVAPIESKPQHHITVMLVLAMKWEAAPFRTR